MNFRYYLLFIILIIFKIGNSQNIFYQQKTVKPTSEVALMTKSDSILSESLPELILTDEAKKRELPPIHDNSSSPYLRPVFNQNSSCCGQASGVAYNFTYEINHARDLPSDDTLNQYPAHFTWNFQNSGDGYYGVSYLHSFEILKMAGNPNVFDYGGMDNTSGIEWMTGYDKYYNAMHNRVRGVKQLKVNNETGLLTLKHWLQNHLEGSPHGGIASFYASSPYGYKTLPDDSPEAGKYAMTAFPAVATHAMTIVGYHDSIRYDYNGDGEYTNDIDINEDGEVDMKDWEIGGLKFVNSYGESWADSGFCYMMYKTLADNLGGGGIWNHCIHVLDVKESYEPKLTLKFTIKHDSRGKLKITAGIATDTSALIPEHVMHFPIFNYQGGNNFMQGRRLEELNKYLETGLDITPLLSYIDPGQQAKFFLQITETDPLNEGTGRIIGLTLMDYNNGTLEIPCSQTDIPLTENGITRIGVTHAPDFDKPEITTPELPAAIAGANYEAQIEAQNGTEPYQWNLMTTWHQQRYDLPMPTIDDEQLFPQIGNEQFAAKKIDFEFPFYGKKYDTIYMHEDGFVMFEPDLYPWPYFNDPGLLFRKVRNISAFNFRPVKYYNDPLRDDPEMWYKGNQFFAAFKWKGSLYYFDEKIGEGQFALVLNYDGIINFYYNGIEMNENVVWYAGVSSGNETDYTLLKNSNSITIPEVSSYMLIPEYLPESFNISNDGILSGTPEITENIYNLTIEVTDDSRISNTKNFQISDGLIFSYIVNSGDDGMIENGEEITIDLTIKNIFDNTFHNVSAGIPIDYPFLEIINTNASFGDIAPNESKTIDDAFTLKVAQTCPNNFSFLTDLALSSNEADWIGKMNFEAFAPSMAISSFLVQDDNNNRLDPGETVDVSIKIANTGLLDIENIQLMLECENVLITVNDPVQSYGNMVAGEEKSMQFSVTADSEINVADTALFNLQLSFDPDYFIEQTKQITIGQYTAVIFRKGSNPASAEALLASLQQLGVDVISTTTLPEEFEMFRSVFVCLGTISQNNALTAEEASKLATYLNDGGNIYLEGTMTWTFDPQTPLHAKFKAGAQSNSFISFTEMNGVNGTFTEGLNFDFSGVNNYLPCLMNPVEPAFPIFYADGDDQKCIACANPAWGYNTIGAIHEFGNMGDESNATERKNYMYKILAFFGLEDYVVGVEEKDEQTNKNISVSAYPNPFINEAYIKVNIVNEAEIDIDIFDLSGQLVKQLVSARITPGNYTFKWLGKSQDGRLINPGIYIFQVRSGSFIRTGKLIKMGGQ